jgi:hypothetical protein
LSVAASFGLQRGIKLVPGILSENIKIAFRKYPEPKKHPPKSYSTKFELQDYEPGWAVGSCGTLLATGMAICIG